LIAEENQIYAALSYINYKNSLRGKGVWPPS